jgi:hypothetical protein
MKWEQRVPPGANFRHEAPCPACGDVARCFGLLISDDESNGTPEDGDASVTSDGIIFLMYAKTLVCSVCTLRLDNSDELIAAGIETPWFIEDPFDDPAPIPDDVPDDC